MIREGWAVPPPPQWQAFLATVDGAPWREVEPCRVRIDPDRAIELRAAADYAASLPYFADLTDYWHVASHEGGDCEDLSLALAARLIGHGWPAGCLRLTRCRRGSGPKAGHAVLTIAADADDLIWCCIAAQRNPEPQPWAVFSNPELPMPYRWVDRWRGPARWVMLHQRG